MTSSAHQLLPNSREWFDAVGEEGLRGLQGQAGCIHYADYILQAVRPGPVIRGIASTFTFTDPA